LEKNEDESEVITNRDIMKTDRSVDYIEKEVDSLEPRCDIVLGSSDGEEQFDRMSDLHDVSIKMEVINIKDDSSTEVKPVSPSRAKRKSKHCFPMTPLPLSQLTDKEFCDLQIRLLEAWAQVQQGGAAGGGGDVHQVDWCWGAGEGLASQGGDGSAALSGYSVGRGRGGDDSGRDIV
jgi:hypothetical protein